MNTVYFLYNFNQYHNRRCIRYDTLNEYLSHKTDNVTIEYDLKSGVNFSESDGVNASLTYNQTISSAKNPNYCLIVDGEEIISRWYVIDAKKLRNGQYTLILTRDSVADYYNAVINAPTYIEKATISNPYENKLIFNKEQIEFNQIKKSEYLLKDKTNCNWIVGYLGPNCPSSLKANNTEIKLAAKIQPDYVFSDMSLVPYSATMRFKDKDGNVTIANTDENTVFTRYGLEVRCKIDDQTIANRNWGEMYFGASKTGNWVYDGDDTYSSKPEYFSTIDYTAYINYKLESNTFTKFAKRCVAPLNNRLDSVKANIDSRVEDIGEENPIAKYDGCVIKIDNIYYNAKLVSDGTREKTFFGNRSQLSGLSVLAAVDAMPWQSQSSASNAYDIVMSKTYTRYVLELTAFDNTAGYIEFTGGEPELVDEPYKMFCIPYDKDDVAVTITNTGVGDIVMSTNVALAAAMGISRRYTGSGELIDLQLLPYCPLPEVCMNDHEIDASVSGTTTLIKGEANNNVGVIFWSTISTWSFTIDYTKEVEDFKVESQCDLYRLCAPNYSNYFEYNLAENYGVNGINVDCTYKPHSPYIHLNPVFNDEGLFGGNFHDARGLICGGDYGLPQTSDAWETYQIQNSTYNDVYTREVQHMKFEQGWDIAQSSVNAVTGTVSGVFAGLKAGGIPGAIAGGVSSAVGGAADIARTASTAVENLNYKRDMFNASLQNIKALPTTLSNVNALNKNNKYFPFIEYYTCTENEKEAFRQKIYYNGMTVNAIGLISEYLQEEETYIKGQLIRVNVAEDNHLVEALTEEINRGVFIK